MTPSLAGDNTGNMLMAYSILIGKASVGYPSECVSTPYLGNDFIGKFVRSVKLSICGGLSSLFNHIRNVFFLRAKEHVKRVATRFNVAGVATEQSIWNLSEQELIHGSVRKSAYVPFASAGENPVTIPAFSTIPNPTPIRKNDLGNKSFKFRLFGLGSIEFSGTNPRAKFGTCFFGVEKLKALGTLLLNHKKLTLSFIREGVGVITGALSHSNHITSMSDRKGLSYSFM